MNHPTQYQISEYSRLIAQGWPYYINSPQQIDKENLDGSDQPSRDTKLAYSSGDTYSLHDAMIKANRRQEAITLAQNGHLTESYIQYLPTQTQKLVRKFGLDYLARTGVRA